MLKLNTDDRNDENELFLRNGWPTKDLLSRDYCQKFSQTFDTPQSNFDTLQARFAEMRSDLGRMKMCSSDKHHSTVRS